MSMVSLRTSHRPDITNNKSRTEADDFSDRESVSLTKANLHRNRWNARMNTFDLAVMIGFVVAIFAGFATGLVRSAITIVAYLIAAPIAVWVMSYVPPL